MEETILKELKQWSVATDIMEWWTQRQVRRWVSAAICKNGGGFVMIWGFISASCVGDEKKTYGIINAEKYGQIISTTHYYLESDVH